MALVVAQVIGYALSKLVGVKLISELTGAKRSVAILGLIGISWLALVLFAIAPAPLKVFALFLNGLPLGLIWGLVFSYLEGRRTSEVLGAILCASFIVASGLVKSVAVWLMTAHQVTEWWMPAATGAIFMPLLALSVAGLSRMPPPTLQVRRPDLDRARLRRRVQRLHRERAADRGDHARRPRRPDAGQGQSASTPGDPVIMGFGLALIGLSTLAFQHGMLSPLPWMIASGAGLYLAYTPFNAMLFDRLIAATRQVGTAGFLIYLADASGYMGSVALTLTRNQATVSMPWLSFFMISAGWISVIGCILTILSAIYFARRV